MQYECQTCRFIEVLWNSRDGVTPFVIRCRRCGADAQHVNWNRDRRIPEYKPSPGERVFRDGSPLEAQEIVRHRLDAGRAAGYVIDAEVERIMLADAINPDEMSAWLPGWPHVVEVAT